MNNEHLVPVLIQDLIAKFNASKNENERMNLIMRLEAIVEASNEVIDKYRKSISSNYNFKNWKNKK